MKNVILMGGSGYIGTHLMEEWLKIDSKVQIISLSRNGKPDKLLPSLVNHKRVKWMAIDIFNMDSYLSELPTPVDLLINLIGTADGKDLESFMKINAEPVKVMIELMDRLSISKGCFISGRIGMPLTINYFWLQNKRLKK
ncbi:hypothetical protein R50345_15135 [Paenibacillus sp. FSL R5-0345]|uniref:NAD-dependent epimerase/dehydratase family protein n=1 Tax=Paenibacillus sp. FSL R5-0345 TaxID=1536770 RepID=UPI0004F873E7|nr:NAD-dependent epimerase/dehydratase family protein [Paenibacillus sp. FSL R5-0345]AIQ35840.1 hypothetical protein R50345_15135 [Paenibacillus sp. FSL R5-0345]